MRYAPTLSSFIRPTKSEVGAEGAERDALIELKALLEAVITRSQFPIVVKHNSSYRGVLTRFSESSECGLFLIVSHG